MANDCPVCGSPLLQSAQRADAEYLECPRCGSFALSHKASVVMSSISGDDRRTRAMISHVIRRMTERIERPMLSGDLLRSIIANTVLPDPEQQLRNLIAWLGKTQGDAGAEVRFSDEMIAAVGAVDIAGLSFIASQAKEAGLVLMNVEVESKQELGIFTDYLVFPMKLTIAGWRLLNEIRRGTVSSRVAFMAMPFGIVEMDEIYREYFCAAVAATGFQLKRLDEGQPAGLIDDRLRVEIRQSRFLISDLTHRNPGAYWEAGYAEGLGKPVIYTCRKDVFDEKSTAPHFDTNHHLTVVWDPERMGEAVTKLKATIRATLPGEATLANEEHNA